MNTLYYGDNLQVLQEHIPDGSVDLVYLDPPFNSNASYNVLFKERTGEGSAAQIAAFEDTWHWGEEAARTLNDLITGDRAPTAVKEMMEAFRQFLKTSDMMAYLTMMAPRLVELHRVLKPTGSLYLHCDPTASHYLKLLMDAVFGPRRFLNEVSWKRSSAHSDTKQGMRRYGRIRDLLLVYRKSEEHIWNSQHTAYAAAYSESEYRHVSPEGRRYKETDLTAAKPGGDTEYGWRVKRLPGKGERWEADLDDDYLPPRPGYHYASVHPYKGRFWAYSKENLVQFAREGRLVHRRTGMPRLMQFADEMPGVPLQDSWDDISPALGNEVLGYDTQKPLALLERIIAASSNEGDVVLDPFCGCGTAVAAAQKLGRRWIGVDVTHLAVALMKHRLKDMFNLDPVYRVPRDGELPENQYLVVGEPVDVASGRQLGQEDRYQFQYWALSLLGARPEQQKRGADRGIDGTLFFLDGPGRTSHKAVVQVKSGHVSSPLVRDLKGTVEREGAALGLFITLEESTQAMRTEAASAGFFHSDLMDRDYPRIQIRTVAELLDGRAFEMPLRPVQFQQAQRVRPREGTQPPLVEQPRPPAPQDAERA